MQYGRYDKKRLLTGTPWKEVLIFSLPLMMSAVLQNLYGVVDTFVVGEYIGKDALAIVGTSSILVALFQCISWGFSFGITAVLSRYNGADNSEGYEKTYHTAVVMMILMGIGVCILGFLIGSPLMKYVMGVPEEFLHTAEQYFYISLIGVMFVFTYNVQGSVLRSVGNTKLLLYSLAVTSVLNIFLDVSFITVFNLGVAGVAFATMICNFGSLILMYWFVRHYYPEFVMSRKDYRISKSHAREITGAAAPMAAQQLIIFSSYTLCQNPINSYGVDMMAAFSVERRIESLIRIPMTAFSAGMLSLSGMAYGARDKELLFKGVKQVWVMSMAVTFCISLLTFLITPFLMGFFNLVGDSYEYGVSYMRVVALSLPLFIAYFVLHGFFQGVKRPIACTAVTLSELFIRLLALYGLGSVLGYSIVWWSVPISWLLPLVMSVILYLYYKKKVIVEMETGPQEAQC